jgi:signal transduction histidine kinase
MAMLPRPISIAAYRVVQEALSNVRRHAATGARVDVQVVTGDAGTRVEVIDDGGAMPATVAAGARAGRAPIEEGFGLVGMRERVVATGGQLDAGPVSGGGFKVVAEWPAR